MTPHPCDPCTPLQLDQIYRNSRSYTGGPFLGFIIALFFLMLLVRRELEGRRFMVMQFVPCVLVLAMGTGFVFSQLGLYFGIPEWLKGGYLGGPDLPTSCGDSKLLFGERNWPCGIERYGAFDALAPWIALLLAPVIVLGVVTVPYCRNFGIRNAKLVAEREKREERRKRAEALGEEISRAEERQTMSRYDEKELWKLA